MAKKNKGKVIYLETDADNKIPLISLYSLPTKCPVCHSFQEPDFISFQCKDNGETKVFFRCVSEKCKSSFSAFYLKGSYGKEQYHFICF